MVYKRGGDFRIGHEIPCNLPFPAAGKQGVRENSSQGNHVTNITLAHFFLIPSHTTQYIYVYMFVFIWLRCCLCLIFLQLSIGPARYAEETTLCTIKASLQLVKKSGFLRAIVKIFLSWRQRSRTPSHLTAYWML